MIVTTKQLFAHAYEVLCAIGSRVRRTYAG